MSFKGEFAEILKEKLGEPPQTDTSKKPSMSFTSSAIDWILPIFAPRKTWTPQKIPGAYPKVVVTKKKPTPRTDASTEEIEGAELSISLANLSEKGKKAFGIMVKLGANFQDKGSFKPSELKSQYRKLARIYHPDSQDQKASNKHFNMASVCYKFISNELKQKNH